MVSFVYKTDYSLSIIVYRNIIVIVNNYSLLSVCLLVARLIFCTKAMVVSLLQVPVVEKTKGVKDYNLEVYI